MSRAVLLLTLVAALTACSANPHAQRAKRNEQAIGMQQMLAEAGFVESMLDTPEKIAQGNNLPQREIVQQDAGAGGRYVYVDVALCGCMYSGNASAYERYRQRVAQQTARNNNFQAQQIFTGNQKVIRPVGRYD